jgi:hypothetical protein
MAARNKVILSPVPARKNLDPRVARTLSRHIERYYTELPEEHRNGGALWYHRAANLAEDIGRGNLHKGAGIIAALSPQTGWAHNVEIAKKAGRGNFSGLHTGDNIEKAKRIYEGEDPMDILGGHKVRNFYQNISRPDDPEPVTIDRHAHDIAINKRLGGPVGKDVRGLSSDNRYQHFLDAYHSAAHRLDEPRTNSVQAATWLHWAGYNPNEGFPKGY